jgi:hypothetical protein
MGNPKLEGSGIIEAIPQTGECPLGCEECYYNGKRFYRSLDTPLLPSLDESLGKIVRVNSGHDSNIQRDLVIKSTEHYLDKFYNTSIANFDFPGPVVFTANGRKPIYAKSGLGNVMFVRARTSPMNLSDVDSIVEHYQEKNGIPVVLTFMRYYDKCVIPREFQDRFRHKKNILNEYWCITEDAQDEILERYADKVLTCGTKASSLCKDCGNCKAMYLKHQRKG